MNNLKWLNFLACSVVIFSCMTCNLLAAEAGNPATQKTADHGIVRYAHLINKTENSYTIENIRWGIKSHNPKTITVEERDYFWKKATIRTDMVDQVYYVVKPFFPKIIAGHGYTLMTFKAGGFVGPDNSHPEGLAISYEIFKDQGMTLKDIDFVRKGTHDFYGIGAVMAIWEDYVAVDCELNNRELTVYRINFSPEQKSLFAKLIIEDALKDRRKEFYHTIRNSCVTNQVRVINEVIPEADRIKTNIGHSKILNPAGFVPRKIAQNYAKKGIMTKMSPVITNKNYFGSIKQLLKEK
ncbi:MAG: DUF4105 domain-containing protein [Candidatus Riflebacteria bacterium]|nr:DUF4105 domain-containing protein [Candidatus Riflebacteria bacterium]